MSVCQINKGQLQISRNTLDFYRTVDHQSCPFNTNVLLTNAMHFTTFLPCISDEFFLVLTRKPSFGKFESCSLIYRFILLFQGVHDTAFALSGKIFDGCSNRNIERVSLNRFDLPLFSATCFE